MSRLTDAQLVLLSKASQRDDHAVELPPNLRGAAAQNVIARLLEEGLLLEVLATGNMSVWRRDDEEQALALVITPVGLEAIDLGEDAGGAPVHPCDLTLGESGPEDEHDPGGKRRDTRAAGPRPGSKQALVIALLSREGGASIEDLTTATSWLTHTMRAELTRLRKRGYAITKARGEGGKTVYRVQNDKQPDSQGEAA